MDYFSCVTEFSKFSTLFPRAVNFCPSDADCPHHYNFLHFLGIEDFPGGPVVSARGKALISGLGGNSACCVV